MWISSSNYDEDCDGEAKSWKLKMIFIYICSSKSDGVPCLVRGLLKFGRQAILQDPLSADRQAR